MQPLTKRQKQMLAFVRWFVAHKGYPPSRREIGRGMKIGTCNGVTSHLLALARKGYLRLSPKVARGIQILNVDVNAPPILKIVAVDDFTDFNAEAATVTA